jgi:Raf kinase inhibitor-like YbhB/YbcL family protein
MRLVRSNLAPVILMVSFFHAAPGAARSGQRGAPPPGGPGPGARGGGRGVQVMTLATSAWADGGRMPARYTQAADQLSPPLAWSNVPDGVVSFALLVHDPDAAAGNGTDDTLHWMLWNIPAAARSLPEGVPQGAQLPDGARQVSVSGPYYRGPGAPAAGPAHHYIFELFALDITLDVEPVVTSPAQARAAVLAAMAGHVRGKAVFVGLFKRSSS